MQKFFPISLSSEDNLNGQILKASILVFKIKTKQRDTFFHPAKLRKALLQVQGEVCDKTTLGAIYSPGSCIFFLRIKKMSCCL